MRPWSPPPRLQQLALSWGGTASSQPHGYLGSGFRVQRYSVDHRYSKADKAPAKRLAVYDMFPYRQYFRNAQATMILDDGHPNVHLDGHKKA